MIKLNITNISVDFKARDIINGVETRVQKELGHAAAYIRKMARNSIKRMKGRNLGKESAPGTPPHTHRTDADGNIRDAVTYRVSGLHAWVGISPDMGAKKRLGQIAAIHEYGGNVQNGKTYYLPGMRGPVRRRTSADPKVKSPSPILQHFVYMDLKSSLQAEHANRLAAAFNGKGMLHYPKRPFMRPALQKGIPRVLEFFTAP